MPEVKEYPRFLPPRAPADFLESADLLRWIEKKRTAYQEPGRKGIPRDERRPLSFQKYSNQLFMLMRGNRRSRGHKEVAKLVGTSSGLSRKWGAESDFKEGIDKLLAEYLDSFFKILLEELKALYTFPQGERKDNIVRNFEAVNAWRVMTLIEIADDRWGWLVQKAAHERIEKLLKSPHFTPSSTLTDQLSAKDKKALREATDQMPIEWLNTGGNVADHGAAFLRLLDLVCVVRSKGRVKVDAGYLIRTRREIENAVARMHYDLCIASERNHPATVRTYSEVISLLAILCSNKFCQLLFEKEKGKDSFETWSVPALHTPWGMEFHLA